MKQEKSTDYHGYKIKTIEDNLVFDFLEHQEWNRVLDISKYTEQLTPFIKYYPNLYRLWRIRLSAFKKTNPIPVTSNCLTVNDRINRFQFIPMSVDLWGIEYYLGTVDDGDGNPRGYIITKHSGRGINVCEVLKFFYPRIQDLNLKAHVKEMYDTFFEEKEVLLLDPLPTAIYLSDVVTTEDDLYTFIKKGSKYAQEYSREHDGYNNLKDIEENFEDMSEVSDSTYWTKKILKLLQKRKIEANFNPKTNLYDIEGTVDLSRCNLESLGQVFGAVSGCFFCNHNYLTSLEGTPQYVGGNFSCSDNQLISLEGAPQKIDGSFFCSDNQLITLKGAPQEVGEDFYCTDNQLTTLEGAPRKVGRNFYCQNNKLITLKGAPKYIGRDFSCVRNPHLISLEGAPDYVGRKFYGGEEIPINNNLLKEFFISLDRNRI